MCDDLHLNHLYVGMCFGKKKKKPMHFHLISAFIISM